MTVLAAWKSPPVERVLAFTVVGADSVSCWRKVGKMVVPHRGASSTGVGTAEERPRRARRLKAVVEVRMVRVYRFVL